LRIAAGQLTSVALASGRSIEYKYDAAGNRITVKDSGATTNYSTNNLNQYTTVGGDAYTYDKDGNLASKTASGKTTTFSYDIENRLIGVTNPDGIWQYQYDALGNRIGSTFNGQKTDYLLDPTGLGDVVGEYTSSQATRYSHGLGLVSRNDGTNTSFFDTDAIGSVVGLSGTGGNYLNSYSYLPFGESLTKTETVANSFEYVGQYGVMNEANGLDFMRARFYTSGEGRFLNPDPIGVNGGLNLYKYGYNNPIALIDPTGTESTLRRPCTEEEEKTLKRNYRDLNTALLGLGALGVFFGTRGLGGKFGSLGKKIGTGAGAVADATAYPITLNRLNDFTDDAVEKLCHPPTPKPEREQVPFDPYPIFKYFPKAKVEVPTLNSSDPNDIIGPGGTGTDRWLTPDPILPYTIRFENQATATAPAVLVNITHTLDTELDLNTFELGDFGFGSTTITVPDGLQNYTTRLDLRDTLGDFVDFTATLDTTTRLVTWQIVTIDPLTGEPAEGVTDGFLPPNNANGDGDGFVNYRIKAKNDTPNGASLDAQASIVFDTNAAIVTPIWTNKINTAAPTSTITALPATINTTDFTVAWTGSDTGSGIASYDIYVSDNNSAFQIWKTATTDTSATYSGTVGHTYAFYSIATDGVGRTQANPSEPISTQLIAAITNQPPSQPVLNPSQIAENVAIGSTIGKLTATDPDTGDTLTYNLTTGTGSTNNDLFEIVGDELKLKISPDYETKPNYSVRVKVTDQAGLSSEQTFTISVTDVNEPPTQLVINNSQLTENVPINTVVGTFNATTPNGDTLTYSLVTGEGGTDNQFFEIVNNTIRIKITPDFEIKPNYTVRVKATNQNGLSTEKPFPINITNLNEAPNTPTLSNQQIAENSPINTIVGKLVAADPDTSDTLSYSLTTGDSSTNNNLFEIVGDELRLKNSADFEAKPNYSVRIQVTDAAGLSTTQTFNINITNVNEAPTQLTINTNQTAENSPIGTVVANFTSTDPDAGDSFTYSLAPNDLFTITGNELKLTASPDYETKSSYQIQVKTTDKFGLSLDRPFTINITDIKEPTTLINNNDRTFQISGDKGSKNITFQISSQHQTKFAETGLFKVDDNLGTINNIKPGDPGYLAAALDRFQIISSIIPIANRPQGFDGNTNRSLNLNYGDIVRFGVVNEGSIDQLRQTPAALNQLTLSEPTTLQVTDSNGNLALNWQTPFNLNLTATIDSTPSLTLGTTTQTAPQGELIDLRQTTTDTTATFSIYREAAYNNHVYFYALQNTTGTILDGTTTLNPTDPGYIQAALRNSIADINLSAANQSTSTFTTKLTKGTLFAPIIVVNDTKDAFFDSNPANDPAAYTPFMLGNQDKTDHIRLLGDNTFGFEDLVNGGDLDYNDIIVKVNLQSIG
jgi:RHS repeat-associated protein